jgi:membrane-associated phospholipid phosphatase
LSAVVSSIQGSRATSSKFRWPLLALGLVGMALYAIDTALAVNFSYLAFDVPVERFIQSLNWGPPVQVFMLLDWLGGWHQQVLGLAGIALVAVVNWRAVPLMIAGALSGAIYSITEMVIQRPRPPANLVHVIVHTGSFSYPSGHVAFFTWFLILLTVSLAVGRVPRAIVAGLGLAAALVIFAVCIGRIYLGEHWPSDVLGGLALGLGWTSLVLSVRWLSDPALRRGK